MIEGFRAFEFDLPDALLASLIEVFDNMESSKLLMENVIELPDEQGVYQLLYKGEIVYIGKTDAEAGLRRRLTRHACSVQHRSGLDESFVTFRALRVFVFTAVDLETQLIRHYGGRKKVAWNNSGFGSNDPGRQRDTTKIKVGGFDDQFPIDLDRPLDLLEVASPLTLSEALQRVRSAVPYIIRAELHPQNRNKAHPELESRVIQLQNGLTARLAIEQIVESLPTGWQATLLPGRVILYKENRHYSAGAVIARSQYSRGTL